MIHAGGIYTGMTKRAGGAPAFTLSDLANLEVWFRGDTGLTAAQWDDKSGNGRNLLQATEALQPAVGALSFGPVGATFSGSKLMRTAAFSAEVPQPLTWLYVGRATSGVSNKYLFDNRTDPTQCAFVSSDGAFTLFAPSARSLNSLDATVATAVLTTLDGAATKSYVGGVEVTGSGNPGTAGLTGVTLGNYAGGGAFAASECCEFALWSRILDAGEIVQVAAYLDSRYGL